MKSPASLLSSENSILTISLLPHMASSLILPPLISIPSSYSSRPHNNPNTNHRRVLFPYRRKWRCSATDQPPPPQQPPQRQRKSKNSKVELKREKGVDPVGFLPKFDISHKAFNHFQRERCSTSIWLYVLRTSIIWTVRVPLSFFCFFFLCFEYLGCVCLLV